MTDDPAGPVIDPPGSSRAEQPPPYQWIVAAAIWGGARVSERPGGLPCVPGCTASARSPRRR